MFNAPSLGNIFRDTEQIYRVTLRVGSEPLRMQETDAPGAATGSSAMSRPFRLSGSRIFSTKNSACACGQRSWSVLPITSCLGRPTCLRPRD
jgi:hypothetical protein